MGNRGRSRVHRRGWVSVVAMVAPFVPVTLGQPATTAASASADECLVEREPNDEPATATAVMGPSCVGGEFGDADQDLYVWNVSAADAQRRWTINVSGVPGQAVQFKLLTIELDEVGTLLGSNELFAAGNTGAGAPATLDGVLLLAGQYYIGASSTGTGGYELTIDADAELPAPGDAEPNDEPAFPTPVAAAFELSGDRGESADWYAWTLDDADAATRWQLSLQAPLGSDARLVVQDQTGRALADVAVDSAGRLALDDLGLDAGTYSVGVTPPSASAEPYVLASTADAARTGNAEDEPNDDVSTASAIDHTEPIHGRLTRSAADHFALTVDAVLAATQFDLKLFSDSTSERTICLLDPATTSVSTELICRTAAGGIALTNLVLPAGDYVVRISGEADADEPYLIRVDPTVAPVEDFESEPNDSVTTASRLGDSLESRGWLTGNDADYFHIGVDGEPELWHVVATGTGVASVSLVDGGGRVQMGGQADPAIGGAELADVFLVPGDHWFAVAGTASEYTIEVTPLGPPDPLGEREPNSDSIVAELLTIDEARNGRVPRPDDTDSYRFILAATEHVTLIIEPPIDGAIGFDLAWGGADFGGRSVSPVGEPLVYDGVLPPGDYMLGLWAIQASDGRYSVTLERRDPFTPPHDREPNDSVAQASPLTPGETATGSVVELDDDWYAVDVEGEPSAVSVTASGDVTPALFAASDPAVELGLVPGPTSDGRPVYSAQLDRAGGLAEDGLLLRLRGSGEYDVAVWFDDVPLDETSEPLLAAVELSAETDAVAAHLPDGQRVEATATLTSTADEPLEITLDVTTSDLRWRASVESPAITLEPGGTVDVPVDVIVPADAWIGPVRVSLRAGDADDPDGTFVSAGVDVVAEADAAPVASTPSWPLPLELLGGLDVAATALGAAPIASSDGQTPDAIALLFDGQALPGRAFVGDATSLPLSIDVALAGDEPVPLAGVVLRQEPLGAQTAPNQLREFEVQLSADGVTFETVLTASIEPSPVEQAFVFDGPVTARAARLVMVSNQGGNAGEVRLAEWAVVAVPGVVPVGLEPFDVADPDRGGHLVRSTPLFVDPSAGADLLRESGATVRVTQEADEPLEWIIGFADDRAALINELQWIDPLDTDPTAQLTGVEIAVSTASPTGPWQPLGPWQLDRSSGQASFVLDEAVWARFVRFTAPGLGEALSREMPAAVRIVEVPAGDTYRSILGEWGAGSPRAIHEFLEPPAAPLGEAGPDPGEDAADAAPLTLDEPTFGRVHVDEDVDWFRVDVPAGENVLRLTVTGATSRAVDVFVEAEDGGAVPVTATDGPDGAVFTAAVTADAPYLVRVEQPVPSIVFAYDTSISLANYEPAIYAALNRFASGVVPGHEGVQVIPFGDDPLLAEWSDEPYVIQGAVRNYPRTAINSDSPAALSAATTLLADRPGTGAIVVLTDAETTLEGAPDMWDGLADVQPRVFAVHLGAANDTFDSSQARLQDWVAVNRGFYSYAGTQADIDIAFARAATELRRPVAYTITATAEFVAPPTTTTTTSTTSTTTSTSTSTTSTPSAQPAAPGSISVVAAPAAEGAPSAAVSSNVAVELILDTSGSMRQAMGDSTRADVAKRALTDLVTTTLPAGTPVALRVFGTEPDSCDSTLAVPLGPRDPGVMSGVIAGLPVVDLVRTPLAASLAQVANDLAGVDGPTIVVLLTDGEETCGGDPEAAIRALVDQGIDVHVNIVGFALDDGALAGQFARWAEIGNGAYFDAADAAQLGPAVAAAVRAPFRVVAPDGSEVATGVVGGQPVVLPAGVYTVEALTQPVQRYDAVTVSAGESTTVTLGSGVSSRGIPGRRWPLRARPGRRPSRLPRHRCCRDPR